MPNGSSDAADRLLSPPPSGWVVGERQWDCGRVATSTEPVRAGSVSLVGAVGRGWTRRPTPRDSQSGSPRARTPGRTGADCRQAEWPLADRRAGRSVGSARLTVGVRDRTRCWVGCRVGCWAEFGRSGAGTGKIADLRVTEPLSDPRTAASDREISAAHPRLPRVSFTRRPPRGHRPRHTPPSATHRRVSLERDLALPSALRLRAAIAPSTGHAWNGP